MKLYIFVPALLPASTAFADTVPYNDGAINGNLGSTFITFGDNAAHSFVLSSVVTLTTSNPPLTLDWSIWDAPGPGGIGRVVLDSGTGASLSNTFLFENGTADDGIYQSSFALASIALSAGTYWLELQNAVNPDVDAVLWDVNNGPSEAWDDQHSIITAPDCGNSAPIAGLTSCASAFQITGSTPSPVPEPRGFAILFGVGALCLAAAHLRHRNTSGGSIN
jgi:hypothetical protein